MNRPRKMNDYLFLSAIEPLLFMGRVFGLSTFTIVDHGSRYDVELSRSAQIYSCLVNLTTLIMVLMQTVIRIPKMFSSLIPVMYFWCRLIATTLLFTSWYFNRHAALESLRGVTNWRAGLSKRNVVIMSSMTSVLVIVLGVKSTLELDTLIKLNNLGMLASGVFFIVPSLGVCFITSLLGFQAAALRSAIQQLNNDITALINIPVTRKLRPIMLRHKALREVCAQLNTVYGLPIFFASSLVFIEVTVVVFIACGSPAKLNPSNGFGWCVIYTLPTFVVMQICQSLENVAHETEYAFNKLDSFGLKQSPETRREFREWRLQLRQSPITISGKGFFFLNSEQVQTFLSTIVTYVVILQQNVQVRSFKDENHEKNI